MNKKQWILTLVVGLLFCAGVVLMLFLAPNLSTEITPEETLPVQTVSQPEITEPEETTQPVETDPPTEPPEPTIPPQTETIPPADLGLTATKAFVYDLDNSWLLYAGGDPDGKLAPASLTKLLTSYTAVQFMDMDMEVTVGNEILWIDPYSSVAHLQVGNCLTVEMLLYGLMLPSGNDAAYALAVAGGRVLAEDPELDNREALELFVDEMNEQARLLGMTGSQFKNPDGIDEDGHYTTIKDLIILTKAVMDVPVIMESACTAQKEVVFLSGETVTWKNSNYLLQPEKEDYYTPNAIGLKTGSTQNAGKCLISLFLQEDGSYLAVGVLGSIGDNERYDDTLILYQRYT